MVWEKKNLNQDKVINKVPRYTPYKFLTHKIPPQGKLYLLRYFQSMGIILHATTKFEKNSHCILDTEQNKQQTSIFL